MKWKSNDEKERNERNDISSSRRYKYKFKNRILNIFSNKETINTYLGKDKIIKYF